MIHRIRIQNFKSLRDVTVEFSPVTVLIGKSGTGKTNLASAIGFLRDYLRAGAGGGNLQQQLLACRCATNPSGAIEFQVVFDIPGFTLPFSYTLAFHPQHNIAVPRLESSSTGERRCFGRLLPLLQTKSNGRWNRPYFPSPNQVRSLWGDCPGSRTPSWPTRC